VKRIGIIVPSTNTVAEVDFQTRAPQDFSVHTARMFLDATTAESERRMVFDYLPASVRDIATMKPDVVVFACTSAGAVIGPENEDKLVADMSRTVSAPVVSTNAAVHKALTAVGPSRLAVLTPYIEDLTGKIREGLERVGITVAHTAGMDIVDPFAIAEVTPSDILEFAEKQLAGVDFDALFVSCTNLPAFAARAALEERFGVPVVTSNQAAFDAAVEAVGNAHPG
jgi:maleate isomerase